MRLIPTPKGLMLAGVLLAKRNRDGSLAIDGQGERLRVLLTIAHGKPLSPGVMGYIRRAGALFAEVSDEDLEYADYSLPRPTMTNAGNDFPAIAKLTMMLALSGFTCEDNPRPRLLKALDIMRKGISPGALLKALTKDDNDDSDDDEGDDDSDDNDDFETKHPRWPAGSPGGVGGEFAPKDASTASPDSDGGGISADDVKSDLADGTGDSAPESMVSADATRITAQNDALSSQVSSNNNQIDISSGMSKEQCIDICSQLLPTEDFGASFDKCMAECTSKFE